MLVRSRLIGGAVAVVIVTAVIVTACGSTDSSRASSEIGLGLDVDGVEQEDDDRPGIDSADQRPITTTTEATTAPEADTATTTTTVETDSSTLVATARDHVEWLEPFDEPDGRPMILPYGMPNPHQFGGPLTLMVVSGAAGDEWVEVQLPVRPNGRTGWIRTSDYTFSETRRRAEVDLGSGRVAIYEGDDLLASSDAAVGAEETPTPLGTFSVTAKRPSLPEETWLGPWAIVLSGYSEVLESFSGGEPVIAIHGTDQPELLGEAITFGCVRVPNDVVTFLAEHLPLGAPVEISV